MNNTEPQVTNAVGPIVFLAGPFRNDPEANIEKAREIAAKLEAMGYTVFCPHLITGHLYGAVDEERVSAVFEAFIRMLATAEDSCMMLMEGWESSDGTQDEMAIALSEGVSIYEIDLSKGGAIGDEVSFSYGTWMREPYYESKGSAAWLAVFRGH